MPYYTCWKYTWHCSCCHGNDVAYYNQSSTHKPLKMDTFFLFHPPGVHHKFKSSMFDMLREYRSVQETFSHQARWLCHKLIVENRKKPWNFIARQNIFTQQSPIQELASKVSYMLSYKLTKQSKPFSKG